MFDCIIWYVVSIRVNIFLFNIKHAGGLLSALFMILDYLCVTAFLMLCLLLFFSSVLTDFFYSAHTYIHTHTHTHVIPDLYDCRMKCIGKETYLSLAPCYLIHTLKQQLFGSTYSYIHSPYHIHTYTYTQSFAYIHRSIAVCNITLMRSGFWYNKTLELLIIHFAHTSAQ